MMTNLLRQLKQRRQALGLKQKDMHERVGISRQQYQRLESKGNPRLETLILVAKGLKSELMLIPQEKIPSVMALIEDEECDVAKVSSSKTSQNDISQDPWHGLLGDEEG